MFRLGRVVSHALRTTAPKTVATTFIPINTTAIRAFTTTKPKRGLFDFAKPKHVCTTLASDPSLPPVGDTVDLLDSNENWELCYDGIIGKSLKQLKQVRGALITLILDKSMVPCASQ